MKPHLLKFFLLVFFSHEVTSSPTAPIFHTSTPITTYNSPNRPHPRLYNTSEFDSTQSTFPGFSSSFMERAEQHFQRPLHFSPVAPTQTTVTYTTHTTIPSIPPLQTPSPGNLHFQSKIPRPLTPTYRPSPPSPKSPNIRSTPRSHLVPYVPDQYKIPCPSERLLRSSSSPRPPTESRTTDSISDNRPVWTGPTLPYPDPSFRPRDQRLRTKPKKTSFFNPTPWK